MSRIGQKIISIPKDIEVLFENRELKVKGPKGELRQKVRPGIDFDFDDGKVQVSRKGNSKNLKALHGLYRSLLFNMITGVKDGFTRKLELNGVGYRAQLNNNVVSLSVGYSYPRAFELPKGIECKVEDSTKITLSSHDKQLVGETAARIRRIRPPEPYKQKGIKYAEEVIRTKAGKSGKK